MQIDLVTLIITLIAPPLAVFLRVGLTLHFWINLILTMLGYLPGVIHAFWVLMTFPG